MLVAVGSGVAVGVGDGVASGVTVAVGVAVASGVLVGVGVGPGGRPARARYRFSRPQPR